MKMNPTRSLLLALALAAVALPSVAAEPVNIAQAATTTIKSYNANNEDLNGGGFHGTAPLGNLFNGNLTDGARANQGVSYIVLDFGAEYFVTTIDVTKLYRYKYSLSYSLNGMDWTAVPYATTVNRIGTKQWGVFKTASYVKFVFEEGGSFIPDVAELQVFGFLVSEMACPHAVLSNWTEVANSATCTEPTLEVASCSACGETFTREAGGAPLGHSYRTKVTGPGKGSFSCKRCGFQVDCSNGAVDLIDYGGIAYDNLVQFTDVSVSGSLGWYEKSGQPTTLLVDGDLTTSWAGSSSWNSGRTDWIEVSFGSPILLSKVDVTIPCDSGHEQTVRVLDHSGTGESLLKEKEIARGGEGYQTVSLDFDGVVSSAIRIRVVASEYNSSMYVNEVRVYGTVPGEWTPDPFFILMQ